MLSDKEAAFITYWETNREAHQTFTSKLLRGLPMACIFSFPILFFLIVVKIFFPNWFMTISNMPKASFTMAMLGVFITLIFFSFFRMQFKWEMNEQAYQELRQKERVQDAANNTQGQSYQQT